MNASFPISPALSLMPHELEEHVAATNNYFQNTHFTLDDLHVYAQPLADVAGVVQWLSREHITDAEIVSLVRRAAKQYRAIDDAIEAADNVV